ncbi:DEAD/DEAH box helicase [Methanolobus profundi]|uniref:Replicative superfamily II helicase n=1 Tax=Methanolobus profundi TaxID=487685 RepID=A0A1I4PSS7_9EURY|nr:DEAD/DEAH box helicase [Methanolobus profundi]SFM30911.1 Replicative superfamily II helicase [Methanolobus profundi]
MTQNIDELISFFDEATIDVLKSCGYSEIWDEQLECIQKCVFEEKNTFISLPTGTGKTFPALLAIINKVIKQNGKAIYVVPLKALARQKYEHFKKLFSNLGITVGISTGDYAKHEYTNLGDKQVIVVTNEKLDSLMRHNEPFLNEVSLFVIDEIQMVEDVSRGLTLEIAVSEIIRKYSSAQIIGLSAVIGNPEDFGHWMAEEVIYTEERRIPLKKGILNNGGLLRFNDKTSFQIKLRKNLFRRRLAPRTDQEKAERYSNSIDLIKSIVSKGEQCIVFTTGRKHAENLAFALASDIDSGGYKFDNEDSFPFAEELNESIEERTNFSDKLLYCIRNGISFHHAGIELILREKIENAFLDGTLCVLVATTTLEQGINLPAKTVIISDNTMWSSDDMAYMPLSVNSVLNMMGRAGRPGFHEVGNAVLVEDKVTDGLLHSRYAVKKPEKVLSQFKNVSKRRMNLNGLISSNDFIVEDKVHEYFKTTLWYTLFIEEFGESDFKKMIDEDLNYLEDNGFVEKIENIFISTKFGKIVSDSCIDCETAIMFKQISTKIIDNKQRKGLHLLNPWSVFHALLMSSHVMLKAYDKNGAGIRITVENLKCLLVDKPSNPTEQVEFYQASVIANILEKWIDEKPLQYLLDWEKGIGDKGIDEADIYNYGEIIEWLGDALVKIMILEGVPSDITDQVLFYCDRAVFGVKTELLDYFRIKGIKRLSARKLFEHGYDYAALKGLEYSILSQIIGPYYSKIVINHFKQDDTEKQSIFEEDEIYTEVKQAVEDNEEIKHLLNDHKPTIGIVTALTEEYVSMKHQIKNPQQITYSSRGLANYDIGEISATNGGTHSLILALAGMGNNNSTYRTTLMIERFPSIKYIIMVGIAGAVPYAEKVDDHVRLGDIVVSSEMGVIQYDLIKEDDERVEHRHHPRPPSSDLLKVARLLEMNESFGKYPWINYIEQQLKQRGLTRPSDDKDVLFCSTGTVTSHPIDKKRIEGQPRVFIGPIGSGNRVVKSSELRDELRETFKLKAIEMEGSGVADAAWQGNVGYLIVRGTCDYCDSHKSDDWHEYATIVAAAYAKALIEEIPINP